VGTRDKLDVSVLEGLEERVLSIDCKKHTFHLDPFLESISSLPLKDKEDIERVMVSGVSKRAINFILDTLGDMNTKIEAEHEASLSKKKKHAENVLQSRANDGGSGKSKRPVKGLSKPGEGVVRGTPDAAKKTNDIVPYSTPVEEDNVEKPPAAKRKSAGKRASSPSKKTKPKKMKSNDEETPLVLTATEKGRVITHGEEPSLEEAA
jgi:hypothetical protein